MRGCGIALALALPACGMVLHGPFARIEIARAAPSDEYRLNGDVVPQTVTSVIVSNQKASTFKVVASDGKWDEMTTEKHLSIGAIVGDAIWTLTIVGVIAPIMDLAIGTFYYQGPDHVALVPRRESLIPAGATAAALAANGGWVDLSFALAPSMTAHITPKPEKKRGSKSPLPPRIN